MIATDLGHHYGQFLTRRLLPGTRITLDKPRMVSMVMRALVTRPREESEALAAALAARRIEALIEPLMEIHFLAPRALDLRRVQAILCTSANGVRALARATGERGVPLFAVGDATAARARAEGFATVESAGGDVNDLVRLTTGRLRSQEGPILQVSGHVVAGDLAGELRTQGFTVTRSVLYEARPVETLSPMTVGALCSGAIAFALFFSPRTAAVFARLVAGAGAADCCRKITAFSISSAADTALAGLPWRDRVVAERPDQSALLEALDRVLGNRQQGRTGK
jgi:uroporphyrinogen-III synthase